jgi:hypothetical protein
MIHILSDEDAKAISHAKITKYTLKQIKNLANQELKFFMQTENDLKELTTSKVMQLISLFLNEILEMYPPAEEALVDNFDTGLFAFGALPYEFKNLDETLKVTNSNLLFYHTLAHICQHVPFDFEYLIYPSKYEKEWRLILSVLIDFSRFKNEYGDRHLALVSESQTNQEKLAELTN